MTTQINNVKTGDYIRACEPKGKYVNEPLLWRAHSTRGGVNCTSSNTFERFVSKMALQLLLAYKEREKRRTHFHLKYSGLEQQTDLVFSSLSCIFDRRARRIRPGAYFLIPSLSLSLSVSKHTRYLNHGLLQRFPRVCACVSILYYLIGVSSRDGDRLP